MTPPMRAKKPHPAIQTLLEEREKLGLPQMSDLSVVEGRELLEEILAPPEDPEPVGLVRNYMIAGPVGGIPIRIYTPDGDGPFPILIWFHGGGWVQGTLETQDTACRALTNAAKSVVVSVDYRLAPEHPFPAPVEDCVAATKWVADHPEVLHGDSDRIVIGGDSSGGTLAAAVAQVIHDHDGPDIGHQVLVNPVTDYSFDTASYEENAEGYIITKSDMEWYWDQYLETPLDGKNPYAAPLQARDLSGLPSATVVTSGFDPLRDEGIAYADRLKDAGVHVQHRNYNDMIHGFMSFLVEPELEQARDAIAEVGHDLHAAFDG